VRDVSGDMHQLEISRFLPVPSFVLAILFLIISALLLSARNISRTAERMFIKSHIQVFSTAEEFM
jgi:hypothetical protein